MGCRPSKFHVSALESLRSDWATDSSARRLYRLLLRLHLFRAPAESAVLSVHRMLEHLGRSSVDSRQVLKVVCMCLVSRQLVNCIMVGRH